jgi:hypothetical protein
LPFAGPTYGSGTTIGVGAAALDAATKLRDQLAELAGWPAAQVHCDNGELWHGDHHVKLTELVADLPGPLAAEGAFRLPGDAWADAGPAEYATRTFGAVFAEVGVDPELGLVRLRRATGVYSAGHIVNPRTARSQMIGGLVWGWGMATLEASHFEPTLGRWHSPNLAGVALMSSTSTLDRSAPRASANCPPPDSPPRSPTPYTTRWASGSPGYPSDPPTSSTRCTGLRTHERVARPHHHPGLRRFCHCRTLRGQRPTRALGTLGLTWAEIWAATEDEVRGFLGDHDGGGVRVSAGHRRHHRGIDHAELVHAVHA